MARGALVRTNTVTFYVVFVYRLTGSGRIRCDIRVLTQLLLHVAVQRIKINVFGSQAVGSVFAIHPSASLCLPDPNPIPRPIAGAVEPAGAPQSFHHKPPR